MVQMSNMFTNQFVKGNLEFTQFLSTGRRQDMNNSSLSVLVYEEKDGFSRKMLLVNQARLSGLVSVTAQCVEQIVKMVGFCLVSNLHTVG